MSSQKQSETELQELIGKLSNGDDSVGAEDPAARTEQLVTDTSSAMSADGTLDIDDGLIKHSLSPLLLMLVGLRTDDAHGKGVMEDLTRFFGAELSPGTVYPALHDLDEDGLLEMHELIQTKEYRIDDDAEVRRTLEDAMQQHLALGFVFQQAIDELDAPSDDV
jgi:DNA-binding PadR family transcriptional regulator